MIDFDKLKTGDIVDLLEEGRIILNPQVHKYYVGTAGTGIGPTTFIYQMENNYFTVMNLTVRMDWAGYNWKLTPTYKDNKRTGFQCERIGTYRDNVEWEPTQVQKDRAFKHCLFLQKHFHPDYMNKIRNRQIAAPMFLEV